jgi:DNA invertase Pin-like site-specific DNA recombinase
VSDPDQDPERQLRDGRDYVLETYDDPSLETYVDVISGVDESRGEEYDRLTANIEADDLDVVVVDEISRLSRLGAGAIASFLELALENDTSVKDLEIGLEISLDDSLVDRAVKQMLAGLMGDLARVEHRQKLRRIESGIRSAQAAGKWTGRAPRGFVVDENTKVLRVDTAEFLRVRAALERVVDGEPVASVADASGIPESTLRTLRDDRLDLYFNGVADDDRVDQALDELRPLDDLKVDQDEDEIDELRDRLDKLESALQNQ